VTDALGSRILLPASILERLALFLLATVSAASAAAALHVSDALTWSVGVAGAISVAARLERPPRPLALLVRALVYATLLGTAVSGVTLVVNPSLSDQSAAAVARGLALANAAAAIACLLGATGAPPGASTIPACLGLLVVAAFGKRDALDLREPVPCAFAFAVLWIAASREGPRLAAPPGVRPPLLARAAPWARLSASVALAAGVALAIVWALPRVQERIDQGLYELGGRRADRYSGFSRESRLGDYGSLKLSDRVVLRVDAPRPQYLRGRVFTAFDGRTWSAREGPRRALPLLAPEAAIDPALRAGVSEVAGTDFVLPERERLLAAGASPGAVVTRILQSAFVSGALVAPPGKLLVRAPVESVRADASGVLEVPLEVEVEAYATVNVPGLLDPEPPPAALLAECAALPERGVDPRFLELASELAAAPDVAERIARTVALVSTRCRYSLEPGEFTTTDPLAEFFFEKRKGYCQYFASAAALLLRAQGIACRYVTGFAVSADNRLGGHYVVREHDAHAWLEAYVEGRGWVEVDATPADEFLSLHRRVSRGPLEAAWEWLSARWAALRAFVRRADARAILAAALGGALAFVRFLATDPAGVALVLVVAAPWLLRRRPWRRLLARGAVPARPGPEDPQVPPEVARLLARVDRALAERGRPRPPSRAPREHLESVPAEALPAPLRDAARRAVDAYYLARYAGTPPPPGEVEDLARALEGQISAEARRG
jgi:hypothetical protein